MSSSFKSQGNFLQEDEDRAFARARQRRAIKTLRKTAQKTGDMRLSALAFSIRYTTKGHFDVIVEGIEKMLSDLHKENDMDLKVKEDCEADRDKNTKLAKNKAYAIDTQTSEIVRQKAAIDAKTAEIERLTQEKADLMKQRDESTVNRAKDKTEYEEAKAADEAAQGLIEKAAGALSKFYSDNGLA